MRRPEKQKAWTAVVQGAALFGIGKAQYADAVSLKTCAHYFGLVLDTPYSAHRFGNKDKHINPMTNQVVAKSQVIWVVAKGDLIASDGVREESFEYLFLANDSRKFEIGVWKYLSPDDNPPSRFQTGQKGECPSFSLPRMSKFHLLIQSHHSEMAQVAVLNCDLSKVPLDDFDRYRNPTSSTPFYGAPLTCIFSMKGTELDVQLLRNESPISSVTIKDIANA